jgi:PhnB protein
MNVQTYLFFDGRCEEAIAFYQQVLRAKVTFLMRFKDGPPGFAPDGWGEKVYHATLRIGQTMVNMSDDPSSERSRFAGFALLAHADDDAEAERIFAGLRERGDVRMELRPTMWASRYGIVSDRFGVTWKVQSGSGGGAG